MAGAVTAGGLLVDQVECAVATDAKRRHASGVRFIKAVGGGIEKLLIGVERNEAGRFDRRGESEGRKRTDLCVEVGGVNASAIAGAEVDASLLRL